MKWDKTIDGRWVCEKYGAIIYKVEKGLYKVWVGSRYKICDSLSDSKGWARSAIRFKT